MINLVPVFLVLLMAAHVLGLVFWIYKLATQKQPLQRRKQYINLVLYFLSFITNQPSSLIPC
ncbi:uncharacterized protein LOC123896454 [Trifolium pratense]|uniref:uncharacterized protein LOC123896454 n=1 Tax=Trifolium pratense TaxID=57577 RepID=UPI001E6969FA|nr:uncharacterized protein LOC123896454 [Trifolium pratense]